MYMFIDYYRGTDVMLSRGGGGGERGQNREFST